MPENACALTTYQLTNVIAVACAVVLVATAVVFVLTLITYWKGRK